MFIQSQEGFNQVNFEQQNAEVTVTITDNEMNRNQQGKRRKKRISSRTKLVKLV